MIIKKKNVTLQDVANQTGYSINTVSRAIKNLPIVTEGTRKQIQKVAREMGYVPNRAAVSLRLGRTRTIAFIGGDILNPFFAMLFNYVQQAAAQYQYTVMLFSAKEDEETELKAIRAAIEFGVEGIVLIPCEQSDACIHLIRGSGIPFVLLSRNFPQHTTDSVVCDEERSGYLAARHLLDMGHQQLVYVSGDGLIHNVNMRQDGFIKDSDAIVLAPFAKDERLNAQQAAREIRRLYYASHVTGIGAFCDMMLRYIVLELRLTDPEMLDKIGFVGIDNIDDIMPSPFPFCSVSPDYNKMCKKAFKILLGRINGDSSASQIIEFPVEITCRRSCR